MWGRFMGNVNRIEFEAIALDTEPVAAFRPTAIPEDCSCAGLAFLLIPGAWDAV